MDISLTHPVPNFHNARCPRSPVIHPGDVQVVTAIGQPPEGSPFAMEPLANSIVFSIKGLLIVAVLTYFQR